AQRGLERRGAIAGGLERRAHERHGGIGREQRREVHPLGHGAAQRDGVAPRDQGLGQGAPHHRPSVAVDRDRRLARERPRERRRRPEHPQAAPHAASHFRHSSAILFTMRYVRTYQATAAAAPTARAVPCHAGATPRNRSTRYPTSATVVAAATSRASRAARRATARSHAGHSPPTASPATGIPQRAQGWLEAPGHGAGELG